MSIKIVRWISSCKNQKKPKKNNKSHLYKDWILSKKKKARMFSKRKLLNKFHKSIFWKNKCWMKPKAFMRNWINFKINLLENRINLILLQVNKWMRFRKKIFHSLNSFSNIKKALLKNFKEKLQIGIIFIPSLRKFK